MASSSPMGGSGAVYNVRYYGAHGDGAALDTVAIQAAIDACHAANGGVVLFPAGSYLSGTLYLRSQVTLHLNARATLLGSTDIADYATDTEGIRYEGEAHMDRCLLFGRDCRQIGISGEGTIDGQGELDHFPNLDSDERPMLLRLVGCQQVHLRDVTLRDPAAWTTAFIACRDVRVEGLTIDSRANYNGDGLDFDGCQDVFVSRCRIASSDDCICLQTSERDRPCQNVVISDCILSSEWAGIRIGLLSCGDLRNVTVSNCVFRDIKGSGIKVQMNEGGVLEDMLFSNLAMENVPRPVFVTFNSFRVRRDAGPQLPPMRALRNLQFRGIRASAGAESAQSFKSFLAFVGLPGNPIEGITLSDVQFTAPGGGTHAQGARRDVPELIGKRPEHQELGETLPAYGVYARHVKGLVLDNVTLDYLRPELRPAIVCDDVQGLDLVGLRALCEPASEALIRLQDVRGATLRGCRPLARVKAFVSAEGQSRDIGLLANDLRLAGKVAKRGPEVGKKQVLRLGNLRD